MPGGYQGIVGDVLAKATVWILLAEAEFRNSSIIAAVKVEGVTHSGQPT